MCTRIICAKLNETENYCVNLKSVVNFLKNPIKLLEYRRALYSVLSNQTQQQDVEQEWEQIKKGIMEAANEVIQKQDRKQRSEW